MELTSEHELLRQSLGDFIDNEINPFADQWEESGPFPAHEVFKKMGDMGWLGITKPEEFGGTGLDFTYNMVFHEEIGRIRSSGVTLGIAVQTDMATPALARFGSDELRQEFLAPSIAGDYVACIGVSEPHAGSDVAAIKTRAERQGDEYVVNGTKTWITNATQADWVCLLANSGDGPIHKNKSLFVVPMSLPGVSVSEKFDKLGMRSSDTAQIFFDNVRIPKRFLIGEEGSGFVYQMLQFQEERLCGAATVLKRLEALIEETAEYTRERMAFGRPLIANQVIAFRLAELQVEIEALRALVYRAVSAMNRGEDVTKLATMAKLKAGKLAREVSDACLQFFGGMGFMAENNLARAYRDLRLVSIGGGADEIMLEILCKYLDFRPVKK